MNNLIKNPIISGADPHAAIIGDKVWFYPTHNNGNSTEFYAYSSSDFQKWQTYGPILKFDDVSWIYEDGVKEHWAWAPCIASKNNKYYFYFSVGSQCYSPSRIGVAIGNSPQGSFVDSGKPLLTGGDGFEAIDPMVFQDPESFRYYLYAGGSAGATLRVFELTDDMMAINRELYVDTPPCFTEGVFMHFYNDTYYLSYSGGRMRKDTYSVHYATSPTPLGPWDYKGPILVSDDKHKGPGHHSIIHVPQTDQWYIFYHRWNNKKGPGPYEGSRKIAIDKIEYDDKNQIKPVVMTDAEVEVLLSL